jgi:hypothetical protein
MGETNRHTVVYEDDVWEWAEEFANEHNVPVSEVLNRAAKVYAGKMASGDWIDPQFVDKYDKQIEELTGGK